VLGGTAVAPEVALVLAHAAVLFGGGGDDQGNFIMRSLRKNAAKHSPDNYLAKQSRSPVRQYITSR
jgi:hypothetical protein